MKAFMTFLLTVTALAVSFEAEAGRKNEKGGKENIEPNGGGIKHRKKNLPAPKKPRALSAPYFLRSQEQSVSEHEEKSKREISAPSNKDSRQTRKRKSAEEQKAAQDENQRKKKPYSIAEDNPSLEEKINTIHEQITLVHNENPSNWKDLIKLYHQFKDLAHTEGEWELLANNWGLKKNVSQEEWKDTIGGHLFYPWKMLRWEDQGYTEDLSEQALGQRIDTLWSLGLASAFNSLPSKLARVQLGATFRRIWLREQGVDAKTLSEYKTFFKQALHDAYADENHPQASYILGCILGSLSEEEFKEYVPSQKQGAGQFQEALRLFQIGAQQGYLRSEFQLLNLENSSSLVRYLALAQKGYGPALFHIANKKQNLSDRVKVLEESYPTYPPLLIPLAQYHKDSNVEKVRELYLEAGRRGISRAYIHHGCTFVGDPTKGLKTHICDDDIAKAVASFTQAGQAHNLQGWDYLAELYISIYRMKYSKNSATLVNQDEKERDKQKIFEVLQKGMALGSAKAYRLMERVPIDTAKHVELLEEFGPAPQDGLWDKIMNILNR